MQLEIKEGDPVRASFSDDCEVRGPAAARASLAMPPPYPLLELQSLPCSSLPLTGVLRGPGRQGHQPGRDRQVHGRVEGKKAAREAGAGPGPCAHGRAAPRCAAPHARTLHRSPCRSAAAAAARAVQDWPPDTLPLTSKRLWRGTRRGSAWHHDKKVRLIFLGPAVVPSHTAASADGLPWLLPLCRTAA